MRCGGEWNVYRGRGSSTHLPAHDFTAGDELRLQVVHELVHERVGRVAEDGDVFHHISAQKAAQNQLQPGREHAQHGVVVHKVMPAVLVVEVPQHNPLKAPQSCKGSTVIRPGI